MHKYWSVVGTALLVGLVSGCSTPPEPVFPTAADTCAELGDVLTLTQNARSAYLDGRISDQEYDGTLRLAARVLHRIDPSPELEAAVAAAREVAPSHAIGVIAEPVDIESEEWWVVVDGFIAGCRDAGVEFAGEGWVGG